MAGVVGQRRRLVKVAGNADRQRMITRGEILMLGIASGVSGGLIGGMLLGIGMAMVIEGIHMGWLLLFVGAPASAIVGWVMGRRLARQVPG